MTSVSCHAPLNRTRGTIKLGTEPAETRCSASDSRRTRVAGHVGDADLGEGHRPAVVGQQLDDRLAVLARRPDGDGRVQVLTELHGQVSQQGGRAGPLRHGDAGPAQQSRRQPEPVRRGTGPACAAGPGWRKGSCTAATPPPQRFSVVPVRRGWDRSRAATGSSRSRRLPARPRASGSRGSRASTLPPVPPSWSLVPDAPRTSCRPRLRPGRKETRCWPQPLDHAGHSSTSASGIRTLSRESSATVSSASSVSSEASRSPGRSPARRPGRGAARPLHRPARRPPRTVRSPRAEAHPATRRRGVRTACAG